MSSNDNRPDRQSGVVVLALFVLIIIGVLIAAFLFVKREHDKKSVSTTAAEVVEAGGSAISRGAQNAQRKNDVALMLSVVADYRSSSGGQLPTAFSADMLKGMGYYTGASIVSGEREGLTTDELRLVTGARCLASGATTSGTSRQYAAQYSLKTDDNKFEPQCKDG